MKFGVSLGRIAVAILGGTCNPSGARAADSYIVPKLGFECFRQHIGDYKAVAHDPVVIYFPICPKVELTAQDLQSNTVDSLPSPGPTLPGAKNVITLTKAEIDCIANGKAAILPTAADAVTIKLNACR